jgi:hypothetical protein
MFTLALAAYNLVRLRNVLPAPAWINRQVRVVIPSEAVNTLADTFRPSLLPAD